MREYDVALSFAGEDRHHAERLAELLRAEEYSVFYDEYELAKLWGKDLYVYLSSVYKDQAEYCVMFLSKHYARKMWTNRERQSAQARAFEENQEYILPVRLDDTEIPGILPTVGYLDLRSMTIEQVHQVLVAKLSGATSQTSIIDISTSAVLESNSGDVITPQILERTEESMNKVFISYVSENIEIVDRLCQELKSHGIQVWLDRDDIDPGLRWKQEIRRAIQQGAFFIACFSKEYNMRDRAYMNEELVIAIEELRQRPVDQAWFIPVKLNECEIPDRDIGGGETLLDLQYVNLYEDWDVNIQRIREIVQPASSETINANTVEQSVNLDAVAEFFKGVTYQNRRNYEKAVEHYTEALRLNPQLVEAYNNRGNAYCNKKSLVGRAIEDYTRAIDLTPNYAIAYYNRGTAYYNQSKHNLAIEDFNAAIDLNPNFAEAFHNRGVAYSGKNMPDLAIVDFDQAIQLKQNLVEAYNNRGAAYNDKNMFDHAIKDFNKAIQLNPNYAIAYNNRGNAHKAKREYDRAIEDYNKAINLAPDFAEAYNNRGTTHSDKDDCEHAIEDFNAAIQFKPDYAEAYYSRGNAYSEKSDYDGAIEDYNAAINLKPDYAEAYYNCGNAYAEKDDFDRAIGCYNKAIELKPNLAQAYNSRGAAYYVKRNYKCAIVDYDKAIELEPNYADAYYNSGLAYYKKGNYDRAIEDYNKAIALKPNYANVYNGRGAAYYVKRNYDRAIKDFTQAIELHPNDANAYNSRGMAYRYKGAYDRAIKDFTQAIELKPDLAGTYHNRGVAWLYLREWDKAREDLIAARKRGRNIITAFCDAYGSVPDFELITGIQLPADLAAMLTPQQ